MTKNRSLYEKLTLKEPQMILKAKESVLAGGDWWDEATLISTLGLNMKNPSSQLREWERDGAIFSVHHDGVDYFPSYGFDLQTEYSPHQALKKLIEQFAGTRDGWGLAFWLHSVNSFLGGRFPKDLLATQPDLVVGAAADELIGVVHA